MPHVLGEYDEPPSKLHRRMGVTDGAGVGTSVGAAVGEAVVGTELTVGNAVGIFDTVGSNEVGEKLGGNDPRQIMKPLYEPQESEVNEMVEDGVTTTPSAPMLLYPE